MNKVKKGVLAILALAVITSVATAFSLQSEAYAYAEPNRVATREAVDTLEQLRATPVEEIAAWEKYDSRNYGIVTPVKNQGSTNLCWVYGSLAAMETNILRQGITDKTADTLDLDEVEFAKAAKGKWDDPLNIADGYDNRKNGSDVAWDNVGAIPIAAQFAARGQGVYEAGEITDDEPTERYSSYFLRNAISCGENVDDIKRLIAEYGGVAFTFNSGYINYNYYYATGRNDHASFIVGWDDGIDKNLFNNGTKPASRNGAWIVKNSYGTGNFIDGYFYLSYDSKLYEITAFDVMPASEYDYCYNYSDKVYNSASYTSYSPDTPDDAKFAAVYKAQKGDASKEILKGVSVGVVGSEVQITVSIYTDVYERAVDFKNNKAAFNPEQGNLAAREMYTAPYDGLYTIWLNDRVELKKDSQFTILVQLVNGCIINDNMAYRSGATFTYAWDNGKWVDMSFVLPPQYMGVLCIKALTVTKSEAESIDISNGDLQLSDNSFTYTGSEHRPEVTLRLDGDTVSPDNYTVEYENNINAGTATVIVEGKGNYTGSLQTTFVIAKADRPDFEVHIADWTYGQSANSPYVSNYGLEAGNVSYAYSTFEYGPFDAAIPRNAGTYYVKAEMDETSNYQKAIALSSFSILKADTPERPKELDELIVTKDMKTLSDIRLPSNWAWRDPDTRLVAGIMQVYVVYAGNDCENFKNTIFQLELNVPEPEHRHELTLVDEKAATCTVDGHTSYYACSDCEKWFEDENGEREIIDHDSVIIPAAHDYTGVEWSKDKSGHWLECAVCNERTEKFDHNGDGEDGDCSVCGHKAVDPKPDESGEGEPETPGENNSGNGNSPVISGCSKSTVMGVGFGALTIIIATGIILITLRRSKK